MNRSVKKMALELKSILQKEITGDEKFLLDAFLSFIILRILQAKGLMDRGFKLFEKSVSDSKLLSNYLSGVDFLNRNFDCFYSVDEIKNQITCQTIAKIRDLFQIVRDQDWKKEEVLSWSYEYFNDGSEYENGVISQFYTPKWIVDYLVESTLVKYYEDGKGVDAQDIRIIDPACGCGNFILGVYDKLKEMYQSRGYEDGLIPKLIITKNLYGIDIDENGVEITNLLLRLKALEDGANEKFETNIVSVPKVKGQDRYLNKFEKIGSLMREEDILRLKESEIIDERLKKALDILSLKYDIVLTNPPYLDSSDYDFELRRFIKEDYNEFKKNLYACFIKKSYELVKENGYVGMITPQTFMFIGSYEKTRRFILDNFQIEKLVHFGLGGVFDNALVDTAMFVLRKSKEESLGEYINLTSFNGKDSKKRALFSIWKENREDYLSKYVFKVDKRVFTKVPRVPFIYWVDSDVISTFENEPLDKFADVRQGIATGDNQRFLRYFWEVRREDISFDHNKDGKKWVPYSKGGPYNKWYGNLWWVIAFDEESYNILSKMGNYLPNRKYYFQKGITYTMTTSKGATFRYLPTGFLFDCKGSSLFFSDEKSIFRFLGLLNGSLFSYLESFIAGSVDLEVGDLKKLPVPQGIFEDSQKALAIETLARLNVAIKKQNTEIFPNELHFNEESIDTVSKFYDFIERKNALDTYLLLSEGLIDILVMELYDLKEKTFQKIYKTVGIPSAFFPFSDDKNINSLPPLKDLLKSRYLYDAGLNEAELTKIEELIKEAYNNKIRSLISILPFDDGITNNHRREPYDNYVEREAEERFQNPITVYNNMNNHDEILAELGFIKTDEEIQRYLLNSQDGFIPFGFSVKEENRLLSTIFTDRQELESVVKKDLMDFIVKDYLRLHEKFYKDRPIVWKLGNRECGFLIHYHNLNEKTKNNILSFLRKRVGEKESYRELVKIIESKNFDVNIDDGVLKNRELF